MSGRYDVDAMIGAPFDVDPPDRGRLHDGLNGGRSLVVQYPGAADVDVLEDRLDPAHRLVGQYVVDPVLVEVVLELAVGDAHAAPVARPGLEIALAAVQEDELAVPGALVTVAEELAVQPDLAVLEALLVAGTLGRERKLPVECVPDIGFRHDGLTRKIRMAIDTDRS